MGRDSSRPIFFSEHPPITTQSMHSSTKLPLVFATLAACMLGVCWLLGAPANRVPAIPDDTPRETLAPTITPSTVTGDRDQQRAPVAETPGNPVDADERRENRSPSLATLGGQVIDASSGAPIAGALVRVGNRTTRSDVLGNYRLTELPLGRRLRIRGHAEGYAVAETRLRLTEPDRNHADLELEAGVAVFGTVFDRETGAPIQNAEVRDRDVLVAQTDDSGSFAMNLVEGRKLVATITARDYCSLTWRWEVSGANGLSPRLPLTKPAWIEGRVKDSAGTPLAGVAVRAQNDAHPFGRWEPKADLQLFGVLTYQAESADMTGPDGAFRVAVAPRPSPYTVVAQHPAYAEAGVHPVHLTSSAARPWVEVDMVLGAQISGRVQHNGKPWSGEVRWEAADGHSQWVETDGQGGYILASVPAGTVRVFPVTTNPAAPSVDLRIEAGQEYTQDLTWHDAAATITGRVTAEGDSLVSTLRVVATSPAPDGHPHEVEARTGDDGTYALAVEPGRAYDVSVQRGAVRRTSPSVMAGTVGVDFALPRVGQLLLQLVDSRDDTPIRSAGTSGGIAWKESPQDAFASLRAPIDVDGQLRLELPVGLVDVQIHLAAAGFAPALLRGIEVTDRPREAVLVRLERGLDVTIRLAEGSAAHTASSLVVFVLGNSQLTAVQGPFPEGSNRSNQRIQGVNLWVEGPSLLNQVLRFERGAARASGLRPGRYVLRSYPDDLIFEPSSFELTGDRDLEVSVRAR